MKRILLATAGVAVVAVFAATLGFAQPGRHGRARREREATPALPTLPADIKTRNRFDRRRQVRRAAVRLHRRPGKNAGFDVEIAKWFARYAFGREQRVSFVCAPTAAREPLLTTGRVDLVISTFTYTADRDTRIDFSRAYYKATGRLLVKNDSPIRRSNDIAGKKVATTSGSIYDRWMKTLLHEHGGHRRRQLHERAARLQPGPGGRGHVRRHRRSRSVAAADRDREAHRRPVPRAPVRHRDRAGQRGAEALGRLPARADEGGRTSSCRSCRNNVPPRFVPAFSKNILRPNNNFTYAAPATLRASDTVCP